MLVSQLLEAKNDLIPDEVLTRIACLFVRDYVSELKAKLMAISFSYSSGELSFTLRFRGGQQVRPLPGANLARIEHVYDMVGDWEVEHATSSYENAPDLIYLRYVHSIECDIKKLAEELTKVINNPAIFIYRWTQ